MHYERRILSGIRHWRPFGRSKANNSNSRRVFTSGESSTGSILSIPNLQTNPFTRSAPRLPKGQVSGTSIDPSSSQDHNAAPVLCTVRQEERKSSPTAPTSLNGGVWVKVQITASRSGGYRFYTLRSLGDTPHRVRSVDDTGKSESKIAKCELAERAYVDLAAYFRPVSPPKGKQSAGTAKPMATTLQEEPQKWFKVEVDYNPFLLQESGRQSRKKVFVHNRFEILSIVGEIDGLNRPLR